MLIKALSDDIDNLLTIQNCPILFVAGDLNLLNDDFLSDQYGLTHLVDKSTHGNNILDRVFCSRPDLYYSEVFKSLNKTKHSAVIVSNNCVSSNHCKGH